MSFENELVKFDYNQKTLYVNVYAKKALPKDDSEFDEFLNYFDIFYQACYQKKKKVILLYDLINLGLLKYEQYNKWTSLFKKYEFITQECLICSTIICNNKTIVNVINGLLKVYSNTKPIKTVTNKEEAIKFINKHL